MLSISAVVLTLALAEFEPSQDLLNRQVQRALDVSASGGSFQITHVTLTFPLDPKSKERTIDMAASDPH